MKQLSAAVAVTGKSAKSVLVFRAEVAAGIVGMALRVVLTCLIWRAVYAGRSTVADVGHDTALGYALLGAVFTVMFQPWHFSSLVSRAFNGNVIFDILRPMSLPSLALGQQLGTTLAAVPKAVVGVVIGLLLQALPSPPGGPVTTAAFLASIVLGLVIAQLCNLIISMTAFWTVEVFGAIVVYHVLSAFCSGALIPLWFMPAAMSTALKFLPFSAQIFTPLSIYFAPAADSQTLVLLGVQLGWVLVLAAIARLVWKLALRRVEISGG